MAFPITVTVGPLAAASATKISLSQKAASASYLVLNGVAGSFSANSICLSQTPSGAGALTLNGALATTNPVAGAGGTAAAGSAVAYLGSTPQRIYITGGSDESGKTFAVVGTVQSPGTFGPGIVKTETITGPNASVTASANAYSTIISITASAATTGAITVGNYGTATLDLARRVLFTSAGIDSGITATVSGTDWAGDPISETLALANASTAYTVLDYLTVTSVLTSAAIATTITVGTNGIASSPWVRFDNLAAHSQVSIQCNASGTISGTVQQTMDDPNIISNQLPTPTYQTSRSAVTWINHPDANLVTFTTSVQGNYGYAPVFARVLLNSGSGTVTSTFMQSYLR